MESFFSPLKAERIGRKVYRTRHAARADVLFAAHGHDVRLMSPEYVRPYVKAQKNDDRDAEGIAEATRRLRFRRGRFFGN